MLGIQPRSPPYGDATGMDINGPHCHSRRTSTCGSPDLMTQHKNPASNSEMSHPVNIHEPLKSALDIGVQ